MTQAPAHVVKYIQPPTLKFTGVKVDGVVVTETDKKDLLKWSGGPVSKFGNRPVHVIVLEFHEQKQRNVQRKRGKSGITAQYKSE